MKKFTLFTLFVTFTSVLFAQTPVIVPEGLETEIYIFSAKAVEEGTSTEPEDYTYQSRIGFDGNDMYIKGLSANTADMWLKATKNAEGKYVIPANQYMGQLNFGGWLVFDYYLAARDENDKAADVVLDFDAENNKFTTNQTVVLHESPEQWYPYQTFTEVAFTKYAEAAATPVDPTMDRVVLRGKYPYIRCTIPATGTNDEALNKEKLYYTVWIEKDGQQMPYTFTAGRYSTEEDMTEIEFQEGSETVNEEVASILEGSSSKRYADENELGQYGYGEDYSSNDGGTSQPADPTAALMSAIFSGADDSES